MISRSRSSEERSPPLASGWWRFTSALKRVLTSCAEASASRPSVSSALRSALRARRFSDDRFVERAAAPSPNSRNTPQGSVGGGDLGRKGGGWGGRRGGAAVHAHLPGGAMPDDRILRVAGDVVGAHPGKEIVRVVVLAHVIEAEPPVLALAQ